jgi:hypothetical protein
MILGIFPLEDAIAIETSKRSTSPRMSENSTAIAVRHQAYRSQSRYHAERIYRKSVPNARNSNTAATKSYAKQDTPTTTIRKAHN